LAEIPISVEAVAQAGLEWLCRTNTKPADYFVPRSRQDCIRGAGQVLVPRRWDSLFCLQNIKLHFVFLATSRDQYFLPYENWEFCPVESLLLFLLLLPLLTTSRVRRPARVKYLFLSTSVTVATLTKQWRSLSNCRSNIA